MYNPKTSEAMTRATTDAISALYPMKEAVLFQIHLYVECIAANL